MTALAAPHPLTLQMLGWLATRPRTYGETMDAWRTSCPRLPIWEDAVDLGLVARKMNAAGAAMVVVTADGAALLREPSGAST